MAAPASGNGGATASAAPQPAIRPEPTRAQIAEAAYFRHLNRRGDQGDEFTDWIEAERELRQRQSR